MESCRWFAGLVNEEMQSNLENFKKAIQAAGLTPPETIIPDGKIHRFSSNGKANCSAGWYVVNECADMLVGIFGDWRTGLQSKWCSKDQRTLTSAQRQAYESQQEEMAAKRDADKNVERDQAASLAVEIWNAAEKIDKASDHPYLLEKGVQAHGLKVIHAKRVSQFTSRLSPVLKGLLLVVPMWNAEKQMRSLQFITADGIKRPLTGGEKQGCYFSMGELFHSVVVVEGFATGATIQEVTGLPVAVAFDSGNLQVVAMAMRSKFPTAKIIIAGDDDWKVDGNPGHTKAAAAARAVDGYLAIPTFGADRPEKATDFNDLCTLAGVDAVKTAIAAADIPPILDAGVPDIRTLYERSVVLTNGDQLEPEPVHWLWESWLALGKLHLIAGAPGQAKTTIAMSIAATVTIGGNWPDGSACEAGNVLIWSGEDDPADTLLPRLIAAGADRSRCYFISGTTCSGKLNPFDPSKDMAILASKAKEIGGVRLLIIDPVVSVVIGDSHKNAEVRRSLQPVVDWASESSAAVIGITHVSKGTAGSDPASRVIGSVAFVAVSRIVMLAAKIKGKEGEDRRMLARVKSNIGPDGGGFEYCVDQLEALPGIHASYIKWGQFVDGIPSELLTDPNGKSEGEIDSSAVSSAEDFLLQLLSNGSTPSSTVKGKASLVGISYASIRRASDSLRVRKTKGFGGNWYWSLPAFPGQLAQDAQPVQGTDPGQFEQLDDDDTEEF